MARALQRVVLRRPVELTGVKRTFLQLTTMSVVDLGCVKTQKSQNRRELFFSDQAKANTLKNSRRYNCDSEKRSFYRRRAPLRFYTAKTQSGHCIVRNPLPVSQFEPLRSCPEHRGWQCDGGIS